MFEPSDSVRNVLTKAFDRKDLVAEAAWDAAAYFGDDLETASYDVGAYLYCFRLGLITEPEYTRGIQNLTGCSEGVVAEFTAKAMPGLTAASRVQGQSEREGDNSPRYGVEPTKATDAEQVQEIHADADGDIYQAISTALWLNIVVDAHTDPKADWYFEGDGAVRLAKVYDACGAFGWDDILLMPNGILAFPDRNSGVAELSDKPWEQEKATAAIAALFDELREKYPDDQI